MLDYRRLLVGRVLLGRFCNFFQISNQVSLGHTEIVIINSIKSVIQQIADQEKSARQNLISRHQQMLQDRVFRAFGILENAHIISSNETIDLFISHIVYHKYFVGIFVYSIYSPSLG